MSLACSPDGTLLASACLGDTKLRVWELETLRERPHWGGPPCSLSSLAFSPDGSLLATTANDGKLGLWSVATGQERSSMDTHATCLRSVAFAPDGRTVVLATQADDDVRFWGLASLL